jgi:hypothetical protein
MADRGKWFAHKDRLVKDGLLDLLFATLDDRKFTTTDALNFAPLLIGQHSQRLSDLLDRCLNIRKEVRELEILAVKAATDYELFVTTSQIDEQMDILRLQIDSKTADQTGFQNAVADFAKTATLEKGLSDIAQGRSNALGDDLNVSNQLQSLIQNRWQALRQYQDDYHVRYTTPGNAHNYRERAALLLEVLTILLNEALARATALATGISQVYGVEIKDLPTSVTLRTIDQFAVWALRIIRSLSRASEQETETEVVVPLVQPWLPPSQTPLVQAADFNAAISNAATGQPISLSFSLPQNGFLDPQTRLKSIGVSFGNPFNQFSSGIDGNQTTDTFTRLMLKVTLPLQTGEDVPRPPIVFGNVGLFNISQMSLVQGSAVQNLSPFGTWNITINPCVVWKDDAQRLVSTDDALSQPISDLKLSLRFYVPGTFIEIPPLLINT